MWGQSSSIDSTGEELMVGKVELIIVVKEGSMLKMLMGGGKNLMLQILQV